MAVAAIVGSPATTKVAAEPLFPPAVLPVSLYAAVAEACGGSSARARLSQAPYARARLSQAPNARARLSPAPNARARPPAARGRAGRPWPPP